MSVASVVNADYSTVIETLRNHLDRGTQPSNGELLLALAVIKDASNRFIARDADTAALRVEWDTQIAILQAGGAGDISAAVDTADTEIEALVVAMEANAAGPTFTAATKADADYV